MSDKFTPADDEVLIDLVRQHPRLYSVGGRNYKDMVEKNNIWKEISDIMKKSVKACQTRWKNIRDYYQKKKCKEMQGLKTGSSRNNNEENFGSKYKHLIFLDNTSIAERRSITMLCEKSGNIFVELQNVVGESEAALSDMEDMEDTQELVDSQVTLLIEILPTMQEPLENKGLLWNKFTIKEKHTTLATSTSNRKRKSVDDDTPIAIFFRSIALTVEQFPPNLQTIAKVQVMQAISELEVEHNQL